MTQVLTRIPRLRLYAILLSVSILLGNLGIMLFVREERFKIILIDGGFILWYALAALALFYAARCSALYSSRLALAWAVLGLAELCLALGCIIFVPLGLWVQPLPFPSHADIFYVSYYPLFLLGILLLPGGRLTRNEWLKTGLDMTIVMLAATLVLWRYWLGPLLTLLDERGILLQFVSLAYPVGDLVLFSGILMLLYRQVVRHIATPLLLLAVGAVLMIVSDANYGYQGMFGIDASDALLDLGWVLSVLSHGLAGIWQATSVRSSRILATSAGAEAAEPSRLETWLSNLPYVCAIAAYLMLEIDGATGDFRGTPLLSWGVGLIIGLVLLRQMVTVQENRRQAQTLRKVNRKLHIEIGERKRAEAQLAHDALHDALTGLPNRVLFLDRLRHAIEFTKRHPDHRFSVLFLDLDHFKVINDSLGHACGDQLLIAFAQRLRMCLRVSDTVARLGGDEFVILLEDTEDAPEATSVAERIQEKLAQPFNLEGHQVFTSASIGVLANASGYERPDEILRDADTAMYQAKTNGKARLELFSMELRERAQKRQELEEDLRHALERQGLILNYQPILALESNRITGFEALLRWRHPQLGLVSPAEFIPVAEETGLIVPIGRWVLAEACRQLHEWQVRYPQTPPLTMNVNISGAQFAAPDFVNQVQQILSETPLDPATLRLELTESVWLNSTSEAAASFRRLNQMGIQLHIDDFGTGYSSLAYLQAFPIRTLKIDQSFVSHMDDNSGNTDLVRAVIAMAHDLGMEALAEGIETPAQLSHLKELGCNFGQGYLFSHPVDPAGIEQLLQKSCLPQSILPKQNKSSQPVRRRLVEQRASIA